jgi:two-component system, sensor histidine kinase YesM
MYEEVKKIWNNFIASQILVKLIMTYVFTIFLPIIIISILYMRHGLNKVRDEYINAVEINLKVANEQITRQILDAENISSIVSVDPSITSLLSMKYISAGEAVIKLREEIIDYLDTLRIVAKPIYKLRVLHRMHSIPNIYDIFAYDPEMAARGVNSRLYGLKRINDKDVYIRTFEKEDIFFKEIDGSQKTVISIYKPIYSPITMHKEGLVEVSIIADRLCGDIFTQVLHEHENIIAFDEKNEIVWNTSQFSREQLSDLKHKSNKSIINFNGSNYYLVEVRNDILGLRISSLVPFQKVLAVSYAGRWFILSIISAVTALAVFAWFIYRRILINLKVLILGMEKVRQGNFDTRIPVTNSDEIGRLSDTFNQMTERIQNLLKQIIESGNAEKEAVYKALSNQIQPHFLNNALDIVRMRALSQGRNDISQPLELIMRYFIFNLGKKGKVVTIEDELKNVEDYINIYKLSRDTELILEIRIDEEIRGNLAKWYILKFSLQPIVENCIRHGFKNKDVKCRIFIFVKKIEDKMHISIEDNGIGMSTERLTQLKEHIHREDGILIGNSSSNIGLRNIKQRIELYYGADAYLMIDSYEGIGTCVELNIPAIGEGGIGNEWHIGSR